MEAECYLLVIAYPNDLMENTIKLLEKMTARLMTRTMFFYGEGTDTWNEESRTNINYMILNPIICQYSR
jgi:hypothetical protein